MPEKYRTLVIEFSLETKFADPLDKVGILLNSSHVEAKAIN